ncbi:hypothetical protein J3B02_003975 [Coemansia erecta]|nr:hypothetical protein J3B02_003975 [Coemansia erecta]
MDRSREPLSPFTLSEADSFRTPEAHHAQRQLNLGEHSTGNRTPATQIAQGAIGRRLNLESMGQRLQQQHQHQQMPEEYRPEHPMASIIQEDMSQSVAGPMSSAFATPLQRPFYGELIDDLDGFETPSRDNQREHEEKQKNAVDVDFILNLNQEADLERLTRRAVAEGKLAWKKETMAVLKKQVEGLNEDSWMYN